MIYHFRNQKDITFYDVNSLKAVLCKYSVGLHIPGRLYTVSQSLLLYVNHASYPCDVRWLFCGGPTPKPVDTRYHTDVTCTGLASIYDLCCVQSEEKTLLIVTCGCIGVLAYNAPTGILEWNIKGNLPGMRKVLSAQRIAAGDFGHLFICDDYNDSIQMFNLAGQYMGAVTKEGDSYIGKPWRIQWCINTASLVVAHVNSTKHNISKIQINTELVESQNGDVVLNESSNAQLQPIVPDASSEVEPQSMEPVTSVTVSEIEPVELRPVVANLPVTDGDDMKESPTEDEPFVDLTEYDTDPAPKYKGNFHR